MQNKSSYQDQDGNPRLPDMPSVDTACAAFCAAYGPGMRPVETVYSDFRCYKIHRLPDMPPVEEVLRNRK